MQGYTTTSLGVVWNTTTRVAQCDNSIIMSSVRCLGLHNNNKLGRSSHWQQSIKPSFVFMFCGEEKRKRKCKGRGKEGGRMHGKKSGETKEEEDWVLFYFFKVCSFFPFFLSLLFYYLILCVSFSCPLIFFYRFCSSFSISYFILFSLDLFFLFYSFFSLFLFHVLIIVYFFWFFLYFMFYFFFNFYHLFLC